MFDSTYRYTTLLFDADGTLFDYQRLPGRRCGAPWRNSPSLFRRSCLPCIKKKIRLFGNYTS